MLEGEVGADVGVYFEPGLFGGPGSWGTVVCGLGVVEGIVFGGGDGPRGVVDEG